jgi:hypothetical protein
MSIKEFSIKTALFIVLPALIIYIRSCEQDMDARYQAACQDCIQALHDTTLTAITIVGSADSVDPNEHIVQKHFTDAATLRRLSSVAAALCAERVDIVKYRSPPTAYRIILAHGRRTCDVNLSRASSGRDIMSSTLDSEYVDKARRFYDFADSLFQYTPGGKRLYLIGTAPDTAN